MIMMGMMNMMMHDDYDQAKVGMGTRPHPQSLLSRELRRMRGRGCPSWNRDPDHDEHDDYGINIINKYLKVSTNI